MCRARIGVLLAASLFACPVIAQEHKFGLGISGSLERFSFDENLSEKWDNKQTGSSAIGLRAQYNITEHLTVLGGVYYADNSYALSYKFRPVDPNDPHIPRKTEVTLQYTDVQLLAGYRFMAGSKVAMRMAGGWTSSFPIDESIRTEYLNNSVRDAELYGNKTQIRHGVKAEAAVEYRPKERLQITLAPYFRYHLTNLDELTHALPASTGVALDVAYFF